MCNFNIYGVQNILLDPVYKTTDACDIIPCVNVIIFGVNNILLDPLYKATDAGVIILYAILIIFGQCAF